MAYLSTLPPSQASVGTRGSLASTFCFLPLLEVGSSGRWPSQVVGSQGVNVPVITGIRCQDGVVLAATGPGTSPAFNGSAPQRRLKPLRVIAGQALLGVSGHDGLAQELALSLREALAGPDRAGTTELAFRTKLQEALAAPVQRAAAIQRTLSGLPGAGGAGGGSARAQSLIGLPLGRAPRLYVLGADCSLVEVTDESPCVAVGPLGLAAETFLTFVRRNLWGEAVPTTRQAELAACWALMFAAGDSAEVLDHAQLVVMARKSDGTIEIAERGGESLASIRESIEEMEGVFRQSFGGPARGPDGKGSSGDQRPVRKRVPEVRFTLERPDARRGFATR